MREHCEGRNIFLITCRWLQGNTLRNYFCIDMDPPHPMSFWCLLAKLDIDKIVHPLKSMASSHQKKNKNGIRPVLILAIWRHTTDSVHQPCVNSGLLRILASYEAKTAKITWFIKDTC